MSRLLATLGKKSWIFLDNKNPLEWYKLSKDKVIFLHTNAYEVILCQALPLSYSTLYQLRPTIVCLSMPTNLETHTEDLPVTYMKCSLGSWHWLNLVSAVMLLLNAINLVWYGGSMTFEMGLIFFSVLIYDSTLLIFW